MIEQTPNTPTLADLKYPKATQALIKTMDLKMAAYAEADTELAVLEENITNATYQDAMALKAAAMAGKPDPGTTSTEAAKRAVVYQTEVVLNAMRETNKVARTVRDSIEENKLLILELALDKAQAGILKWQDSIELLHETFSIEEKNRQAAFDGLKMVSDLRLTSDTVQFGGHFPISGNLQVPKSREDHAQGIIDRLRKMFLEDAPEVTEAPPDIPELEAVVDGK